MRASTVVMVTVALVAVSLFVMPTTFSSAETVTVYYEENKQIDVSFPNGNVIEKGGTLVIILSSEIYDMEMSGITFCERDENGNTLWHTSISPYNEFSAEGNTMTRTFINIQTDIEMIFNNLKDFDGNDVILEKEDLKETFDLSEDMGTTIVMGISLVIAIVMMAIMMTIIRRIDYVDAEEQA